TAKASTPSAPPGTSSPPQARPSAVVPPPPPPPMAAATATAARRMPALDQTGRASAATVPPRRRSLARPAIGSWTLRIATAAALGIDAIVHWQNAPAYDAVGTTLTQGALFRAEAVVAAVVGLLVLIRPRPSSWLAALLVAASALAAALLYRYVDVGALGPLPDVDETTWQ